MNVKIRTKRDNDELIIIGCDFLRDACESLSELHLEFNCNKL
jgi:hypothetical protein